MRGPTHALAGASSAGLLLAINYPHQTPFILLSAIAGFAALVPDLDGSHSMIENTKILGVRPLKGPAYIIDRLFKHRGFLHSLMAMIFLAFILLGFFPMLPKEYTLAILFGYMSHLVLDSLTPLGIPWLYPLELRIRLVPKWLAITTGSIYETLFFVILIQIYFIVLSTAGYINLAQ